ncbi:MAG: 1-acyl-sn-glycerol-3-phosphate acyltransferase [Fimbriimonas ginsengisoli]|uniref:1-acyl-sn-glycerol-3-phosphate acyltransferase n=1 Tax=Fimbriimonas ginsengisoli TaxID=1005039 RepID=A0A931LZ49_FIMGI|nr:1-acyl-sn-glycerol-3-phosphate acyltransferase [Fimbriimonas ginsengisoli]
MSSKRELNAHNFFTGWVILPLARLFFGLLFLLLGPIRPAGRRRVPRKGGLLILSNHLADVDPIVVQLSCPRPVHFMAKSELFEMRLLGWGLRLYKAFPVRRGEPDKGAIRHAVDLLRAGHAVCVFPEGELSQSGELLPLKPGVALIVRMAGVPVICAGIQGSNRVLPYGRLLPRFSFRAVRCAWGEPREFDPRAGTEEVMGWAQDELRRLTGQPGPAPTQAA